MADDPDYQAFLQSLNSAAAPAAAPAATAADDFQKFAESLAAPGSAPTSAKAPPVKAQDFSKLPFAQKVMYAESGGDPDAANPNSHAIGLGQFLPDTWLKLVKSHAPEVAAGKSDADILALRNDPAISTQMIDAYGNDNAAALAKAGIPVNDASKYGAHWFGPQGFASIANAPADTPIEKLIGSKAAADNNLTGKTAGEIQQIVAKKMGMDYLPQTLSAPEAAAEAVGNFPSSLGHAAAGIYESVRHPFQTLGALKQIVTGLDSKIRGYAGEEQDPDQKAKDEQLVDALAQNYSGKYGTWDGFKNYLAHDPAGVLLDASTVASGGELGAGTVAKGLSKIGADTAADAASAAGRLSGRVASATNPFNPGGILTSAAGITKAPGAGIVTPAGTFTPAVEDSINRVTKGAITGADFSDPTARQAFIDTLQQKGINDAAVREGIMKSFQTSEEPIKVPTSVATGEAPIPDAREAVAQAIAENNEILAKRATALGGASLPSTSDIGAALEQAQTNSYNKAQGLYAGIRSMPGSFGPRMATAPMWQKIGQNLKSSGLPSTPKLIAQESSRFPQAYGAMNYLNDKLWLGKTALGGELTAPEILDIRSALTDFARNADGKDIKAMHDIVDGFDQHIADSAAAGNFRNAAGNPVPGLDTQINAANAAYKAHRTIFDTPNGANNSLVAAVKKLKSGQGRAPNGNIVPSGDSDLQTLAQQGLGKDLLDPVKGGNTYNMLVNALGGKNSSGAQAVNDYVRQSILANDGAALKPPKSAAALLNTPGSVATRAFTLPELSEARRIHAASALNNARATLPAQAHSLLSNVWGRAARHAMAAGIGYSVGELPGLLASQVMEGAVEKGLSKKAVAKAMKGAPSKSSKTRKIIEAALRPKTVAAANILSRGRQQNAPVMRASGGKVDEEALVNRLLNLAKKAKKQSDATTKPLLNAPDESIVKALDIAQQAI